MATNTVFSGPADQVKPLYQEAAVATGETILPGHLVLLDSSGDWINHDTAGTGGDYAIADINIFEQKNYDDALTVGQTSGAFVPTPGQTYNLVLAASQTITVGEALTSNGDGKMKSATTTGATPDVVIAYAREAVTTGVGETTTRISARIATAGFPATA